MKNHNKKLCLNCNNPVKKNDRIFCSVKCRYEYAGCEKKERLSNCLECNVELTKPDQYKFCSNSCSMKYRNKVNPNKKKKLKFCVECGIETKRGGYKFCSIKCQKQYNHKKYIQDWIKREVSGNQDGSFVVDVSTHVRHYLFEKYNNKCQICGWSEINQYTNKIPLEIHHIDGNVLNSFEDNLQLLCPNCHSLTNGYRGQKKNGKPHIPKVKFKEYGLVK